jgi:hypothetical protein
MRTLSAAVLTALLLTPALAAGDVAEAPGASNDRFTMSPVEGGFLRLDKRTGAVTMCTRAANDWSCKPVEDRTSAAPSGELARLEEENKALKDRVKALETTLETSKPSASAEDGGTLLEGPPCGKAKLPSDAEVDQALDYMERIYKKIRDRIKDLDKPLPPGDGTAPKGAL